MKATKRRLDRHRNIIALGIGLATFEKGLSVGFNTAAALVSEMVEARDKRASTLITSNLPFDESAQAVSPTK